MTLERYSGWDARLNATASMVNNPFAWSRNDSLANAFRTIDALASWPELGIESTLAANLAGQYDDAESFQTYIAGRGWSTAADAMQELLGAPSERKVAQLHRGDIAYVPEVAGPFGDDACFDTYINTVGLSLDPTHGTGFGRLFVSSGGPLITPGPSGGGMRPNAIELSLRASRFAVPGRGCVGCFTGILTWHIDYHAMVGTEEARLRASGHTFT